MDVELIAILTLVVVAPIVIIGHYITKWKEMKGISPHDEELLTTLRSNADRMERRLESLERILDDEIPDWRRRTNDPL